MESLILLDKLEKFPVIKNAENLNTKEGLIKKLLEMDRDNFSIETGLGVEGLFCGIFDWRNVPDGLQEAYEKTFTNSSMNLHEHWDKVSAMGEESATGFISALKGKLAEIVSVDTLEDTFPNYHFTIADNPTQPVWDIHGISTEGAGDLFVQVKMGTAAYADEVIDKMEKSHQTLFAVSREIYDKIMSTHPELHEQLINLNTPVLNFTENVHDAIETLAGNLGIDLPDNIDNILPYIGEIILGIKLLTDIVLVEKDFKHVNFDDRKRIHAIKAIALISRFGVSSVCTMIGATGGSAILPGLGTIVGALGGAGVSILLNTKLKPHILDIALRICNLTLDDIFYFKNKIVIDDLGKSLART